MIYFDYLRARRALTIFASIVGAVVLLFVVCLPLSHVGPHDVTVGANSQALQNHDYSGLGTLHRLGRTVWFPFRTFCLVAMVIAICFATGCATSLSRANRHLHFTFTKPISRERLTLQTFGVDAVAIVLAFCIALLLLFVPFAVLGLLDRIAFDPYAGYVVFFGLGIALMWYGLVQLVTTRMRGGGVVLGLSYAVFITVASLHKLDPTYVPGAVIALIRILNVVNPFTYVQTLIEFGAVDQKTSALYVGSFVGSMWVAWLVAIVALAACVPIRKRMEV